MKKYHALLFFLLILSGCADPNAWLATKPPEFAKGYRDGCESAKNWWINNLIEYRVLDDDYQNDPLYKEGWQSGYDHCYSDRELEVWMSRRHAF